MERTESRKVWKVLIKWGIPALFLLIGLPLGLFIGSYGPMVLLSRFTFPVKEPCLLEKTVILTGIFLGLLYAVFLAIGGRFISLWLLESLSFKKKTPATPHTRRHERISGEQLKEVEEKLGFLRPVLDEISAVVLVGSMAFKRNTSGSDIDVVLICKDGSFEKVCDLVFQREIDEQSHGQKTDIEYTVLTEEMVREEFRNSSPFSYSLRHGVKIRSDGFMERVENLYPPRMPTRRYILKALYNGILTQYYGSIRDLARQIRDSHSLSGECKRKGVCQGHGPVERFLNVTLKMLYIALPVHSYMPLTKDDLSWFGRNVYGHEAGRTIERVVYMLRNNVHTITDTDFYQLSDLSNRVLLDVIQHIGFTAEIKAMLRDTIQLAHGRVQDVRDPLYRSCLI